MRKLIQTATFPIGFRWPSFFVCCLIALQVNAQKLPFKNYTTTDGLAHDRVNKIVRDSRGFLWFCTGEGLSRFDGYGFKNYTQAHGLPHRSVNDLLEVDGTYLVATDAGLAVFDAKGKVRPSPGERPMFRVFQVPFSTPDDRTLSVSDVYKTRDGTVWAGTDVGLYRLIFEAEGLRFVPAEGDGWPGTPMEVVSLIEDRFGRIWAGTSLGLLIYDPSSRASWQIPDFRGGQSMVEDDQGRIWMGGYRDKVPALYVFDVLNAGGPPEIARRFTTADGLSDNEWFNSMFKGSDGRIYAGVRNGLGEFQPEAKVGEPSFRTIFESDIISVGEDSGGALWIGTATRGAFKLTRRGFILYETDAKPPYNGVTSIFAGSGSEIFVTSSLADVLRFDGEKFSKIEIAAVKARSWGWNQLDLRSHVDGDWWLPDGRGLYRFQSVDEFADLPRAEPKKIYTTSDGLFTDNVFHLFEDSRGDIWIGVLGSGKPNEKDTVSRWDRRADKIYGYTTQDGLPENNAPTAFAEDSAGNIWMGFYGGGVARYRNGKFQMFSARTGFPTGLINAVYSDRKGRIWIATSNSGVVRVENPTQEDLEFVRLGVENGLSSNQANCITEDNFGRIYVGTARGINRIEPDTGRFKFYTEGDGLPGNSIGRCMRDGDGNLWFSQKFAVAKLTVEPDETRDPPPIFIESLHAGGEAVPNLSELGETSVDGLEFRTDQRQIDIVFFALGFGTGETLRYQYRLGKDNWSEASAQRTISLNLSPGSYDFLVRAVNAEGVASDNPARISFAIARPLWQRWWFLLMVALVIAASGYLVYRYRLAQLIKLERVRTRIATDLHDDIGSSLSQIAILSEVARHKAGANGAAEPLLRIADTSRDLVDSMSDIVWAINPQKDHLSDLIHRMRRFAGDTFDATDVGYIFRFDETSRDLAVGADLRRELYLIFKECVNNTAKHSGADRVEINVKIDGEKVTTKIEDNGSGFDVGEALSGEIKGYGGNGLLNMQRRAEKLGGDFRIESAPGKGTTVTFTIPTAGSPNGRGLLQFRRR